jgi:hypothetical protein
LIWSVLGLFIAEVVSDILICVLALGKMSIWAAGKSILCR